MASNSVVSKKRDPNAQTWVSYGGFFNEQHPLNEAYRKHQSAVLEEIADLHDRTCEQQEEQFTIRQLIKKHVQFVQPILLWREVEEPGFQTVDDVVAVGYGIPVEADRHDVVGLYFGLPVGIADERSEFVRFGETQSGPKPMLMVEFRIPRETWNNEGTSWFQSVRDQDFRWLKRVVEAYRREESNHNAKVMELIYRGVNERYKFVRNLSLALGELPLPSDVIESTEGKAKGLKDPSYRVHKQFWFGRQEGICNACKSRFHFNQMTLDHIVPRSKGGSHEFDNLQLLCDTCNNLRGNGTMDELDIALEKRRANATDSEMHPSEGG